MAQAVGNEIAQQAPLSVAALQIVQASLREDTSVATLAGYAERDPAFALRVLSLVNSAAFGAARKVGDVRQASSLLGVRGLRNIGLSLALTDMVPRNGQGDLLLSCCVRRAVACRLLAQATRRPDPEGHFTTGLFLDVGFLSRARSDIESASQVVRLPARTRVVFERSLGLLDHVRLASEVASQFHLPPDVLEAIEHHHDPTPPPDGLAQLAWIAERVAALYEGGNADALRNEARAAMALVGISASDADQLAAQIPGLAAQAAQGMGCEGVTEAMVAATLVDVNRSLAELNESYEALVRRLEALIGEKEELTRSLEAANRELEVQATSDALTGLANRRAFEAALTRDLARADRDKTTVSLVALDVDHFKKVNDTYGHAVGDMVLAAIGQALKSTLRGGDLPARIGGEEFVAILPNTDLQGAVVTAERLRKLVAEQRVKVPGGSLGVTSSFGVSTVRGPGCVGGGLALKERADKALYAAKRGGRNRVETE
ncbi:MAG TPA: diguanylate cyclase [Polyangiaceae bacterium]